MKTIALIGRPNVGKSTLFNRLVGRAMALVDDTPGLTRDWQEGTGQLGNLHFRLLDTAGFEDEKATSLAGRMWQQSAQALSQADLVLFIIDAKEGVTAVDSQIVRWLRKQKKPIILVANKGESTQAHLQAYEAYRLGLGEPVYISAAHGIGMGELYQAFAAALKSLESPEVQGREEGTEDEETQSFINLAIVGRPNAGKSTLVNALLGTERLLTGPEAGMTRDAITVPFRYKDQNFNLIDTAGLRKRARITDHIEKISTHDTAEAIRLAQGVILVIDAQIPLEKQDLTIARHVVEEGRMLIIALNKWDLIDNPKDLLEEMSYQLKHTLGQMPGVRFVPISALKGKKINDVLDAVVDLYPLWNKRLSTADMNRWLTSVLAQHPPPMIKGRRLKIRYVTQIKTRPPTFLAFSNLNASDWPESYVRYLVNSLGETFGLKGVPLRLQFKTSRNPYAPGKDEG